MKKSKVLASFLALALVTQGIPVNVLAAEVARDVEKISVTNQDGMIRRSNDSLIKDPKLEEGIRAQLKLSPGQELTKSMLEGISELTLTNKGIESLDGLENCKGLRKLNLNGNKISNVMPIKILSEKQGMFSGMTNLDLRGNRIQDISPLKDMARYLDSFYLENQKIETTEYVNKPDMNGSYTTSCFINDINGAPMIPVAIKANGSRNGSYSPGQVKWTNLNEGKNVLEYEFSSTGIEFGFGGKASFTGKVVINLNVNKGEAPVIKADPVTVEQGSEFDVMSGVTATDKEGRVDKNGNLVNTDEETKDITKDVTCTNEEDLKLDEPGEYTLKYEVTDSWGNKATAERKVIVTEKQKIINIPDKNLEKALRSELRLKEKEDITESKLSKITSLNLANNKITNLEGLQYCENLETLYLNSMNKAGTENSDWSNNITDLTPLANLTKLETLDLANNNVSNISSLAKLTNLEILNISGNNVTDISSLANLKKLYVLKLNDNNISNINVLSNLTKLYNLELKNNKISDINSLKGLTELQYCVLDGNAISDITPIKEKVLNKVLSTREFTKQVIDVNKEVKASDKTFDISKDIKGFDDSITVSVTNGTYENGKITVTDLEKPVSYTFKNEHEIDMWNTAIFSGTVNVKITVKEEAINIPDKNLEEALRSELRLKEKEDITESKLSKITSLNLANNKITNLEGLQYCKNLETLYLNSMNKAGTEDSEWSNNITDLTPLANLTKLETLDLANNNVSDISSLAKLTNLEILNISGNNVTDISSLANLKKLYVLKLNDNNINNISVLSNLTKLYNLELKNNKISDISPLTGLTELQYSVLDGNAISDITPIKDKVLNGTIYTEEYKEQVVEVVKHVNASDKTFGISSDIKGFNDKISSIIVTNGSYDKETGKITIDDLEKPVSYTFADEYKITNWDTAKFSGTVNVKVTVHKDEIAPELTVDPEKVTIKQGDEFDIMSGVKATDLEGRVDEKGNPVENEVAKDITKDVTCDKIYDDVKEPGEYKLTYTVIDAAGNKSTAERILVVERVVKPTPSVPSKPVDKDVVTEEIVGSNRFETALKISDKWTNADNVVITNSDSTVDAMTAAPFAYAKEAPILLSKSNTLSKATKDRIKELKTKTVYLIGGEAVLSTNIENELKAMGINVLRISGSNRFETSLNIAKEIDKIKDVSKIAVVNGQSGLADSVSISAPAAMNNMPIILSDNKGNIPAGRDFIAAEDISMSYIAGGNAVVPTKVETELKGMTNAAVSRLAGKNRLETNTNVINEFYGNELLSNVFVVKDGSKSTSDLVDALSVSPYAARVNAPVMLVGKDLDQSQEKLMEGKEVEKLTRVGGNGNENAFEEILDIVK